MAFSYIINNIALSLDDSVESAYQIAKERLKKLKLLPRDVAFSLYRRSIDARKKNDIKFVYSVLVTGDFKPISELVLKKEQISALCDSTPKIVFGDNPLCSRPVVVGSGPAGMFAALLLAENGYAPILIERGGDVEERVRKIDEFSNSRILDIETNIQFGAGGAGTFSDGKLVTRINDNMCSYILRRFVDFGAPEEILYLAKPHIGTDYLRLVVTNIMQTIVRYGGEVHYHTRLDSLKRKSDGTIELNTTQGIINCPLVILATGHSARDTYASLISSGFAIEPKPFSVGVRIEHLQKNIDRALYGEYASHPALPSGEYALSANTDTRGVYTFCMCPGGQVVAAASEENTVVVNGMSHHSRNEKNANSAVVVSVFKEDYGNTPQKAIEFQREIESKAFFAGGKNYCAPLCTVGDFLNDKFGTQPKSVTPTYMNGNGVCLSRLGDFLPPFVCKSLKSGLLAFDKKISGFASEDAILTGAETRTSAPVRVLRGENRCALGTNNVYPCGEGAGYAGGITSAAIDGVRTALEIMKVYKPF